MKRIDTHQVEAPNALPLITVGDQTITQDKIAQEMQYHPATDLNQAQHNAARALVVRQLLLQQAQTMGLAIDCEGDEAVISALLERELTVPKPQDEDCRRFHKVEIDRFSEPCQVLTRHILLAAGPDDARSRDSQYHQGQKLIQQLRDVPQRFPELAQRFSQCPSKDQGGELGWLQLGQTIPELDKVLQRLPEGLHDRPLPTRYGWHVVHIIERRESRPLPYEQVEERVRHTLTEQATRRALRHYLLALEADIGVKGFQLDPDSNSPLMQ